MKVKSLSSAQLLVTPWTAAYQAPSVHGIFQAGVRWGVLYWSGVPLSSPNLQTKLISKLSKIIGHRSYTTIMFKEAISEKAMTPHSSTLAWKIPWVVEPGRLQSMGSLEVGHD